MNKCWVCAQSYLPLKVPGVGELLGKDNRVQHYDEGPSKPFGPFQNTGFKSFGRGPSEVGVIPRYKSSLAKASQTSFAERNGHLLANGTWL